MNSDNIKPFSHSAQTQSKADESLQGPETEMIGQTQQLLSVLKTQLLTNIELVFAEFELTVAAAKWIFFAAVVFAAATLVGATFLFSAILAYTAGQSTALTMVLLACGALNVLLALIMFFAIHALAQKMRFSEVRAKLDKGNDDAAA